MTHRRTELRRYILPWLCKQTLWDPSFRYGPALFSPVSLFVYDLFILFRDFLHGIYENTHFVTYVSQYREHNLSPLSLIIPILYIFLILFSSLILYFHRYAESRCMYFGYWELFSPGCTIPFNLYPNTTSCFRCIVLIFLNLLGSGFPLPMCY